jgi:restriction endonuclease S subunit
MNHKLGNIVSIQTGIYRTQVRDGNACYLQVGYFNDNGSHNKDKPLFKDISVDGSMQKHLLQPGDVLLAAKGSNNVAIVITEDLLPAVASTIFLVLRIEDEFKSLLLPKFLSWFLNLNKTQSWIKSKAMGSSISSLSKEAIKELSIPVPTIKDQEKLLKFHSLMIKEKELSKKLIEAKDKLYNEILLKSIE